MKAKKISGGTHHFPLIGRDVTEGEVVEVPDDTNLPAEHFQQVTEPKSKSKE